MKRHNASTKTYGFDSLTQNNSVQMLKNSPNRLQSVNASPSMPKLRRVFGSESMVRAHSRRSNNEVSVDLFDQSRDRNDVVEQSEHERSIFDKSTFRDFSYKKFKEMFHIQYDELDQFKKQVQNKGETEKNKYKKQYKQKKISKKDYDKKIRGVERWVTSNNKQIKSKKNYIDKNVAKILQGMKQQQDELEQLKKKINDPIDCRTGRNNMSSFAVESSLDSITVDKYEASEYKASKYSRITPLPRGVDHLGTSNISILNSACKVNMR